MIRSGAQRLRDQSGVVIVLVAMMMFVFLGIAALAVDLSTLYVVRNELQNAADAGALAGARFLYNNDGTAINIGSNQVAYDAAIANRSISIAGVIAVDVDMAEVQRGHWTFSDRTFTANDSLVPVNLANRSTAELDADLNFINAVRVVARRSTTPAAAFFARIIGRENFMLSADAVAYIGFAGTLAPGEADQPIAICEESIINAGEYSCNVGRMINSGQNQGTNQTGGWTDFNQENPCTGGTNASSVRDRVCNGGNLNIVYLGGLIATNGGEIQTAFDRLETCWINETGKTRPWNMTLPVVRCTGNNINTCADVVGAVNLNLIWILRDDNKIDQDAPWEMQSPDPEGANWSNSSPDGKVRWDNFVTHFNLRNSANQVATYAAGGFTKKTLYFLPDCTPHELKGNTGGENFGVLARIPVLVE